MAAIYKGTLGLIGNTPLVEPVNLEKELGLEATILVKLEYLNPAGSVKDRVAKAMIEDAEEKGILKEGSVIIEPTSGNTGIGLASIAAAKGYRAILTMPETMSVERRNILKAYGAEIVLTEGTKGMKGAIAKAEELAKEIPNSFIPGQFVNPANSKAHRETTGPEIWKDTDGNVDIFIAGVGTGGTLTGVGEYLKSQKPDVKVVALEPAASPVLSEGKGGPHKIQGIGAGFVPDVLNTKIYDEIYKADNDEGFAAAKLLAKTEGILVGISSGAALSGAIAYAKKPENKGKTIVALLPDSGDSGADFLTMTIKKKRPHMSLGRLTLLIDLIIILIGWPVFGDVDSVLYGLSAVFVCSMVIDKILYGIGAGSLAIIVTSKGEETAEEIGRITDRGVTSLEGMGTYTKSKRNVLLCACSKSEAYLVKNAVYQVDDSAFVMFTETSEVLGEGFKESLDEL